MAKRIIIKGSVQGVGCRAYCSRYARVLELRGSASNLADGSVEIILQTDDMDRVREYARALLENPSEYYFLGRIEDMKLVEHSGPTSGDYNF